MKIISRVGKTRLAGLWRSSGWIPAIIIPIIGAIQLAGLSTGQPVKAQSATEQKGNDIVQLVHIPVIASHGSAEGQYMTPEDYEKQKKRFYLKNIANMKEKFFLVQLIELIQDMYMLNLEK